MYLSYPRTTAELDLGRKKFVCLDGQFMDIAATLWMTPNCLFVRFTYVLFVCVNKPKGLSTSLNNGAKCYRREQKNAMKYTYGS